MKCVGVGHPGYRLHYPRVILLTRGRGEQNIDMQGEGNKKEMEGGREQQPVHGEIMIQDERAKAAVTWTMVGRGKSDFIDTWLVD